MANYLFINGSRHGEIHDEDFISERRSLTIWGKPTIGAVGPNGHKQVQGTPNENYDLEIISVSGKRYLIGHSGRFSSSELQELINSTGHSPIE